MSRKICDFLSLFSKIFRKSNMEAKGWTIREMAEKLELPEHTVQVRVSRAGIKPITREAIYPPDTLERIRDAPMGRPPKARPEEPVKAKKGREK
ncbi:MAG: sigma-70 region 4 domain-containing protein [Spirochaetaceae bacterium]|jgi:hypothetical protein|nr:sigma-70 region 4 domain-containing protein [Spirochaetaceae bacterium]